MYNNLIQKNAELGKFLFCERYTLQPVKNSLYIAEGQDLKRGAVVDANGVLVGTNSLMPYAVLENDCDTRAKGAFASVFVKGEFNIDKLFFADGLSKEDLDNIVYNGSGIGIVIKPYDYERSFITQYKKQEYINRFIIDNITNTLQLPPKTIRCKFNTAGQPTPKSGGSGSSAWSAIWDSVTKVDDDGYIWDITSNTTQWTNLLREQTNLVEVLGANSSGVENMAAMFASDSNLVSVSIFDTSNVDSISSMFYGCANLVTIPTFDTSNVTKMNTAFYGCTSLVTIPELNTSKVTTLGNTFMLCSNLKHIPLLDTSSVTNMEQTFNKCTSLTSVPLFNTSKVTSMRSMFSSSTSLTKVPLFNTSKVTNVLGMFYNCINVSSGALALYQQMTTQTTPPLTHSDTFTNCGSNTTTGATELAQIPASWGGTAAG